MSGQALTRDARIAQAAAKAMADAQDARERRDALREGRQHINDALRGFASAEGPGRSTLDPSQATAEQVLQGDERRKGTDQGAREPLAPTHTREELSALMNRRLRDHRRGGEEEN